MSEIVIGMRRGALVVIAIPPRRPGRHSPMLRVRCDCGAEYDIRRHAFLFESRMCSRCSIAKSKARGFHNPGGWRGRRGATGAGA